MSGIPEVILSALPAMSAPEAMCTIVLARATYGRRRRQAWLTYADFQERTMFKGTATIARALKAVAARGFFRRCPGQGSNWEIAAAGREGALFFCEVGGVDGEAGAAGGEGDGAAAEGALSAAEGAPSAA